MRMLIAALVAVLGVTAAHAAPQNTSPDGAAQSAASTKFAPGSVQVAQACGFYAIFSCGRRPGGSVRRAARRMGGYVVNTSSSAYPNFRGGFYCAVSGPKNRRSARQTARVAKRRGYRSAYVKNAC